jgi:nucleotide-binding universal stress UspA family protein
MFCAVSRCRKSGRRIGLELAAIHCETGDPMPYRNILCPIDFSEATGHTVEQAMAMARSRPSSICALHVCQPMVVSVPGFVPPDERVPAGQLSRAQTHAAACFERASADGIRVDVTIDIGEPAGQILARASEWPADLIVVGTHGASGFEHLLLGSVTERVLRRASCPVMTVPPHAQATSQLPFRRLVCAVDFSEWSLRALDHAGQIAQESGAGLTVVHTIEWPWHEPPGPDLHQLPPAQAAALGDYRRYVETSATTRLQDVVRDVVKDRCVATSRVSHGKPYVEILRCAAEEHADLLVLGVHGRNPFDVLLFGSTTNQVVRQATCPVLTIRSGA